MRKEEIAILMLLVEEPIEGENIDEYVDRVLNKWEFMEKEKVEN